MGGFFCGFRAGEDGVAPRGGGEFGGEDGGEGGAEGERVATFGEGAGGGGVGGLGGIGV